ncbi:MAG: flavin reductase family protein [Candidatus Cloacimonetes bacterium]|nr:flavin reductase family protein [Candidatus Cloacimonadota bacterium]
MELVSYVDALKIIKSPTRVALAVVRAKENIYNLITLEWYMRTSIEPPMFAISIGHTRYSYECLQENRFFNLVFPSDEMKNIVKYCGSHSGRDFDKFNILDINWMPGRLNKLPILDDAVANFECQITGQIKSGDHTIFVGEVKYVWANADKELAIYYPLKD